LNLAGELELLSLAGTRSLHFAQNNLSQKSTSPSIKLASDVFARADSIEFPGAKLGLSYQISNRCSRQELDEIIALVNVAELPVSGGPLLKEEERINVLPRILKDQNSRNSSTVTIRDGTGKLVGCGGIQLHSQFPKTGWIFFVAVHPSLQQRGLGRWIMSELLRFADQEAGYGKVYLMAHNPDAIRLYHHLGFHYEGRFDQMVRNNPTPKPNRLWTALKKLLA
jgi:RimJ/RimL family protein N-acetyltransferase